MKINNPFAQLTGGRQIDAGSIDTNNTDREAKLPCADFFNVENHSEITISGTELFKLDDYNYRLKGILGMKGINKEVVLDVEFGGFIKDPYGNEKAGFSYSCRINR